jgi:uncharacterized repeat protein (TIGR01451 family)
MSSPRGKLERNGVLRLTWRRGAVLAAMLGTAIALVLVPTSALAVHDAGCATSANFSCLFELDGNVQNDTASAGNNGGYDWGTGPGGAGIFDSSGQVSSTVAADPSFLKADFNADYATPDTSYFATSAKDTDAISSWNCGSINNPTAKDEILNAYGALFSPTSGVDAGHVIFYAGAERQSNNGNSFMGFWLFKSAVGCSSPTGSATSFTGAHSIGDLLILSNFTGGGSNPLVQVYEWGDPNPGLNLLFDGNFCSGASAGDKACGAVNTDTFSTPWPNVSSPGTSQGIAPNEFVEVGVDVTQLLDLTTNTIPCFARFQAETRSSQETTAQLKDFAAGKFNSCKSTTVTTPQNADGGATLSDSSPVPASTVIRDQAVVTGTALVGTAPNPEGTVQFTYCSTTDQTPGGSTACAGTPTDAGTATVDGTANPATVYSNSIPANTLSAGRYCFTATFTDTSSPPSYPDGSSDSSKTECFMIAKASPSIVTNASTSSDPAVVGTDTTCDSATLSGSYKGTGTITFTLTAPDNTTSQVGSPVTVTGDGTYDSPSCPLLTQVGTYTWHASYSGDGNNNPAEDNGDNESVTSVKASPSIVTNASTSSDPAVVGTDTTCDSATLSGSYKGTGTITFSLTAPDNTTSQVGSPVTVDKDGTYDSPSCPLLTQVGPYTWHAVYSGDSLNNGAEDNGANESITSVKASPMIVTNATVTGGGVVGTGTTCDSATLSGSYKGTGTITFSLTAPDNTTSQVGSPVTVDKDGTYQSPSCPLLTQVGTYTWHAVYSGDSLNNGAEDNGANESVTSIPTSPSITTEQDPASGSVGDTYKDKATLTGTYQQDGSGSITWTLYATNDCSGDPVGKDSVKVSGDGTFETPTGVTVSSAGTYYWVAQFSGDPNNGSAKSGCADEPVTVKGAAIHILKTADHAQVSAGDQIGFTLTVWNSGDGDAKGVKLSDPLPTNPGLSWQIAGQGAGWNSTCKITGDELDCGPVTVPTGTTQANSTFTVHITSTTDKTTGGPCDETGGLVDNTGTVTTTNDGTDHSSAQVCVAAPAIHILKTADAAQVNVGDPIGFTLTVSNDGIGDAHGVMLNDVLPTNPGLSWSVDATGAGFGSSCSITAGVLSCGPVTVPAGTTQAASTFTVHITSPTTGATGGDCPETGVVDNTGHVTTTNDGSDQSTASVCVQAVVDLAITKSGSPATQDLGAGNITWTMTVTNNGPSTDTGVKVSDPMPAGNTYVSSSTTQGTCTGGAILTCDIGTMAAGATVTITLVTTPSTPGIQTNTATVSGDRPETSLANNVANASVEITKPFVPPCVLINSIRPGQLIVGRKTTLTIHLSRKGLSVKGIRVRIKGAGINAKTAGANSKGVIKHTLKMKRKGILRFTPIASPSCGAVRIGVRAPFTPPVTG